MLMMAVPDVDILAVRLFTVCFYLGGCKVVKSCSSGGSSYSLVQTLYCKMYRLATVHSITDRHPVPIILHAVELAIVITILVYL